MHQVTKVTSFRVTDTKGSGKGLYLGCLCSSLLGLLSSAFLFFQTRVHERRGTAPSNPDTKEMMI